MKAKARRAVAEEEPPTLELSTWQPPTLSHQAQQGLAQRVSGEALQNLVSRIGKIVSVLLDAFRITSASRPWMTQDSRKGAARFAA